ncbi:hypothetical protein FZC35_02710 [Candidatus Cytomitobacter indipagum]|uniref:Uncharacterized protein n=1 Tax=Candidatus Cytomitobacter indipagum TaxID=2601575 RepID=A0A5C0UER4_9PROT|nr:hypothetical protein [Candidatus Cytomitobacter indipagum]QEK38259.1 hypothetical protein FZC35_02710 [Candidatus Cytomitobacter indipagum]
MKRIYACSIIVNMILGLATFKAYVKYYNLKCQSVNYRTSSRQIKHNQMCVLQSQPEWYHFGPISAKAMYTWFYNEDIKCKITGKIENNEYITYNISLKSSNHKNMANAIENVPFGNFLVYTIIHEGDYITSNGSITFSKLIRDQNFKERNDIDLKLNAIIKSNETWQIRLNEDWINSNQKNPWDIDIVDVQHDRIKVQWKILGKINKETIKLNQKIELRYEYDA